MDGLVLGLATAGVVAVIAFVLLWAASSRMPKQDLREGEQEENS